MEAEQTPPAPPLPPSATDPPPISSSSSSIHTPVTSAAPTSSSLLPNSTIATASITPATIPTTTTSASVTTISDVPSVTNVPPSATTSIVPLRPAFPINRNRSQTSYPHFAQHLPSNSSPSLPFSHSSSASSSLSSSSSSSSSTSSSSSSSSLSSVSGSSSFPSSLQRGGVAIGVPAYHPRPQQPASLVPSSSFSSPSFGPQLGGLGRIPDQTSSPSTQARTSMQGIQPIGMMGALSGSQVRPGGIAGHLTPRPGQAPLRPQSPSSQSMVNQKQQGPALSRVLSFGNSQLPPVTQSPQSQTQPWMPSQGKPVAASVLSSPSYRPQFRPPIMPQRSTSSQQPNPTPMTPQQQQSPSSQHPQQQQSQQNISQMQHAPEYCHPPRIQHPPVQQPQGSRSQGSTQKFVSPSPIQSAHHGSLAPAVAPEAVETSNQVLSKRSIHELVSQVDPLERLGPEVLDFLVEIVDDFIESTTMGACSLAKHRKSTTLESKDILLYLERNWNMTLPGYGVDEIKSFKKPPVSDVHKQRITAIKKSIVSTLAVPDTANAKTSAGQVSGNVKGHPTKAPAMASPRT